MYKALELFKREISKMGINFSMNRIHSMPLTCDLQVKLNQRYWLTVVPDKIFSKKMGSS